MIYIALPETGRPKTASIDAVIEQEAIPRKKWGPAALSHHRTYRTVYRGSTVSVEVAQRLVQSREIEAPGPWEPFVPNLHPMCSFHPGSLSVLTL